MPFRGYIRALKGTVRRQKDALLPSPEVREYEQWREQHLAVRQSRYPELPEPGLLSILTPVWNGSPVNYLRALAGCIAPQNPNGACEWVIFDNGCTNARLTGYLQSLQERSWIKLIHSPKNIGIANGLRQCLEQASGRYVLPVDGDDLLYPDALRVVAAWIKRAGSPALLYTDEDKVIGRRYYQPYFKPDWDPVLFLNSAYIAHLGVIDRVKALELRAYSDPAAEGSADWDLFMRFFLAGYAPVHIPEVVYSWRVHGQSTADDAASKPYIHASQKAVLQRFLDGRGYAPQYEIEYSPLLGGAAHWHFTTRAKQLPDEFVSFIGEDVRPDRTDWASEALSIFELHPDTVIVGGRIRNSRGIITEAGRHFGFGGACGCPNRGRRADDPGYFAQMWKQRSVSAVLTQFAVIRSEFLAEVQRTLPNGASAAFLGAWAGALAFRQGKRVVYSPFLSGVSDLDWETLISDSEKQLFLEKNASIIPDRRFYPVGFSLTRPFGLGDPACRES